MTTTNNADKSLAANTAFHVALAFVGLGGWAVFANRFHPLMDALGAGLLQGAISGTLTIFLKKGLERMSAMFFTAPKSDEGAGRNVAALIAPPIITATIIAAILVTAHTLAHTPEVFATIAVPWSVSTIYSIVYNTRLWRQANGR
jgi:hypothetical protein